MMKRYIILLIGIALIMPTEAAFANNRTNTLAKESATPRSIYLKYTPKSLDFRVRLIKLIYTQARNGQEAQEKLNRNAITTVYKRRKKGIRVTGLKEETPYCFKAWSMSPKEFRYLAPIREQKFSEETVTEWFCASTNDKLQNEVTPSDEVEQGFATYKNDLLIHSIQVEPRIINRQNANKRSNRRLEGGHLLYINIANVGEISGVQPLKLTVTCAFPSSRSKEAILTETIRKTIPSNRILRVNNFVPRTMMRLCNDNLIATLDYEDEVTSNNSLKFAIIKIDDKYIIRR